MTSHYLYYVNEWPLTAGQETNLFEPTHCVTCVLCIVITQHINNCNYFQYQEEARLQFFESVLQEVDSQQMEFSVKEYITAKSLGPILADTYCKVM